MASSDPAERYAPNPNVLERRASRYLKQLNAAEPLVHRERDPEEVAALRSVERRAVIYAAIAGIASGGLIGGGEIFVRFVWIGDPDAGWLEHWRVWLVFFAFAGVISAIEIAYLYWNALHAIARLTRISGVSLGEGDHAELISRGLARTGLEFPNPRDPIYGIDPYAYVPNWRLTVQNLLYKLKVGVSSFLLRLFMRRVLARMMVRGLVPLIAAPLYAAWNALITWQISREARIRALGPFAITNIIEEVEAADEALGRQARTVMLHGAAELMIRGQDAHPNFVVLLSRLRRALEVDDDPMKVDWETTRQSLNSLSREEQAFVLDVLALSAMLGSKVRRGQTDLIRQAAGDCGYSFQAHAFTRLRTKLIEGRRMTHADLRSVVGKKDGNGRTEEPAR